MDMWCWSRLLSGYKDLVNNPVQPLPQTTDPDEYFRRLLIVADNITVEEINAAVDGWWNQRNRIIQNRGRWPIV